MLERQQLGQLPNGGLTQVGKAKHRKGAAGGNGVVVEYRIDVVDQQSIPQQASVASRGAGARFVTGPHTIHVKGEAALLGRGPKGLGVLQRRARHAEDSDDCSRHGLRVELGNHLLHGIDTADLVAVNSRNEANTGAGATAFDHYHRHVPVLARPHLHPLKEKPVSLTRFQVIDTKLADHRHALKGVVRAEGFVG